MRKLLPLTLLFSSLCADDPLEVEVPTPAYAVEPIGYEPPPPQDSSLYETKKTAAIVIASLAAITVGLLVSGSNTGKEVKK